MYVSNAKRSLERLLSPSRLRPLAALALAGAMLAAPAQSLAAEITWFGQNGSWSNAANWWPNTLPAAGDVVWVRAPAGSAVWVNYQSATGPWLDTVHFDSVGSGISIVGHAADLLRAGQHNIGVWGHGIMVSSGGSHQVTDLNLGFWGGSFGEYTLNPGGTLTANKVFVGAGGAGVFTQAGGSATVAADINVGFFGGAVGTYDLSGAAQLSANKIFVGVGGVGTMRHSEAAITAPAEVTVGLLGTANGRYELRDAGAIATGKLFIGAGGRGVIAHEGGDIDVAADTVIGFLGGSNGTYELSGASTLDSQAFFAGGGGVGRVYQSDGVNTVRGDLVVGNLGTAWGLYELSGGELSSNKQYIGGFGTGRVEQSSGLNQVADLMQIGVWGTGRGTYALSGDGALEVGTLILGGFGIGDFVQTGGSTTVYGGVRIAELPNSLSSLALSGGTFDAAALWNKAYGDLEFTGGSLDTNSLVNDGVFHLSGAGLRIVESPVTNNGRVEALETTAVFPEGFVHAGQYESSDSLNAFDDMTVSGGGTVVADGTSRFTFSGDLRLDDAGAGWDTSLARVEFVGAGGGTHLLRHAGQDLGASPDGYVDNYAWKELSLDPGESLVLEGGALYVRVLDLPGGQTQIASISSSGQNIYYDSDAPANAYLDGETHPLAGSGELIPVPEPSVWLGLCAGAILLSRLPLRGSRNGSASS